MKAFLANAPRIRQRKSVVWDYLNPLLSQYQQDQMPCMFLPSVLTLAKALDCSPLEVQSVLSELRRRGYDSFFMSPDSPVTLWFPCKMSQFAEFDIF